MEVFLITTLGTHALATAEVAPNHISGAQYLSAMIGVILPILVALVTKVVTRPAVKSVILLVLSAVTSFLTEALTAANSHATFQWEQALFGVVLTFIVGAATYFGFWNPTGIDAKVKKIGVK